MSATGRTRALLAILILMSGIGFGTRGLTASTPDAEVALARIVAAAEQFSGTLQPSDRARLLFAFDSAQKTRWSNLPVGAFKREGIRLGDLDGQQRAAAMELLRTALSEEGYQKVIEIMRGDQMLADAAGGRGRQRFGENEYYIAFVGAPSIRAPWMLQFGGHHLAINMTFSGPRATLAPTHTAAQPATYTFEGRTIRPLGREYDKAFDFMATLSPEQRREAVLDYRVADLVLGPGRDGRTIQPEGLLAAKLSPAQQEALLGIVREWAGIASDALAAPRLEEIRGKLPQTYFAWSGPTTRGSTAYFRIQGPSVIIEHAPQGDLTHIHTIYRDPTNDYGAGFVRQ